MLRQPEHCPWVARRWTIFLGTTFQHEPTRRAMTHSVKWTHASRWTSFICCRAFVFRVEPPHGMLVYSTPERRGTRSIWYHYHLALFLQRQPLWGWLGWAIELNLDFWKSCTKCNTVSFFFTPHPSSSALSWGNYLNIWTIFVFSKLASYRTSTSCYRVEKYMHPIFFSFPSFLMFRGLVLGIFCWNSGSLSWSRYRGSSPPSLISRPSTLFAQSFPNLDDNNQFIINLCITKHVDRYK